MSRPLLTPHRKAPRALRRLFLELKSCHRVAEELHVNVAYVHRALAHAQKPTNPRIARRLGFDVPLPRAGDMRLRHNRWWKRLKPMQKDMLIEFMFHYGEHR